MRLPCDHALLCTGAANMCFTESADTVGTTEREDKKNLE